MNTPQSVADALAEILPRRTSIFDVELVQSCARGCVARARIGPNLKPGEEFDISVHEQSEICGRGETLPMAIDALYREAQRVYREADKSEATR